MFQYRQVQTDDESLHQYVRLLKICFPNATHLTLQYLHWLYAQNPSGTIVGMDAFAGSDLAAHYVCVPSTVSLFGKAVRALLSLNTATHPDFRGRGLFTNLASATYTLSADLGYSLIYGVANANSTPGFIKKLGFQLISPLDARLGFGRQLEIDWSKTFQLSEFRCLWNSERLRWRIKNPSNPIRSIARPNGVSEHFARTDKRGIAVWCEAPVSLLTPDSVAPNAILPRLFLGLNPRGCAKAKFTVAVPEVVRPSPLNFITLSLGEEVSIDGDAVSFSFIDFDAY